MKDFKIYKEFDLWLGVIITVLLLFASCKKNNPQPTTVEPVTTQPWENQYPNNGTLPTWTTSTSSDDLVGTTWVLTKIINGFGTTYMSDTLHFVTSTKYYVGSDTTQSALYSLYASQNNMVLTFKPLIPVNYIHCSTDQLGVGFANGTQIIGVDFVNSYNTSTNFKAWFTKI